MRSLFLPWDKSMVAVLSHLQSLTVLCLKCVPLVAVSFGATFSWGTRCFYLQTTELETGQLVPGLWIWGHA
jgi:hypothetical protein